MRERLLTLLFAAGALALFYVLFFPKPQHRTAAQGLPLSTDARPEGYLAIWRWLGREHIPRLSLRHRYGRLLSLSPSKGNLLIITLPQRLPAHQIERTRLLRWVARGNTLLIAAALDDEPLWAPGMDDAAMIRFLESAADLKFTPAPASTLLQSITANRLDIRPKGSQPLLAGVGRITAFLPLPSRAWHAHLRHAGFPAGDAGLPLQLAARSDNGAPALWLERLGAGQIILSAVASPFSNAGLTLPGNARLLSNIIAWSRGPGGAVVFDDAHEGLAAFYDARTFFADPRLHATLAWIVGLWLIFVVGVRPLRTPSPGRQPPDEAAYVEGSARYLAAVVDPGEAAQRMIENFLRDLPGHPPHCAADAWQWLETQWNIAGSDREALRICYERARAGRGVNLVRLQNLLAQLRKATA